MARAAHSPWHRVPESSELLPATAPRAARGRNNAREAVGYIGLGRRGLASSLLASPGDREDERLHAPRLSVISVAPTPSPPPARSNNKMPTRLHCQRRQYTNFGRQMAGRSTRNGIRLFGGSSPRICVRPHEICLKNTHFLRVPLARDVLRALACFNNNL